jgi:hypothetical protein
MGIWMQIGLGIVLYLLLISGMLFVLHRTHSSRCKWCNEKITEWEKGVMLSLGLGYIPVHKGDCENAATISGYAKNIGVPFSKTLEVA